MIDVSAVASECVLRARNAPGLPAAIDLVKPPFPVFALADRRELDRAITALLGRARGGEVRVTVFECGPDVAVSVRHAAPGCGEAEDSKLAVAMDVVRAHGGTVELRRSGPAGDAEVVLRIPTFDRVEGNPPEVLVVDDSRSGAWTLALLLRSSGCVTQIAHSGAEALERLRDFRPAIALVDIEMPQMDGYEVASRMRADLELSEITIVAVSGYGHSSARERAREVGMDDYLVKPVNAEHLLSLIHAAHQRRLARGA